MRRLAVPSAFSWKDMCFSVAVGTGSPPQDEKPPPGGRTTRLQIFPLAVPHSSTQSGLQQLAQLPSVVQLPHGARLETRDRGRDGAPPCPFLGSSFDLPWKAITSHNGRK